jgi:hypothetical protein
MEPFKRLDEAMNARRLELRLNWRQVSEAAGISYTALRAIRKGEYRPTELTARGLDEALRWRPGSTLALLDGGAPTPIEEAEPPAPSTEEGSTTLRQELALAQRLLLATIRELDLQPDEAEEVWRRVRLEIEATHRSQAVDNDQNERSRRTG